MEGSKGIGSVVHVQFPRTWLRARSWAEVRPAVLLAYSAALYLFLSFITVPTYFGDSIDYALSIVNRFQGTYNEFWEFGHALWRPMGWVVTRAVCVFEPGWAGGDSSRYHVLLVLSELSWLFGFAAVYVFQRMAFESSKKFWCACVSTLGFVTAQGFLNYAQAGTPYVAGLAMLTLGIYGLVAEGNAEEGDRRSMLAGIALAGAALLWFPYVLVVPAAILIPVVMSGRIRSSVVAGVSFALAAGGIYLAFIVGLRLHSFAEILAWARASSHGIHAEGWSRAVFGFARSFINMGNDGLLFKRYLLHDPFNPVSALDLLRTTLGKLFAFYVLLGSVVVMLVMAKQKRLLTVLALATVPVLLFAEHYHGGALERYLPLNPFLFLAVAVALSERTEKVWRVACVAVIAIMAVVNVAALSRHSTAAQEARIMQRISQIPLSQLNRASVLFVSHNGDELVTFARGFPWAPLNRNSALQLRTVLEIGADDLPKWRAKFGEFTLAAWAKNGNVWVSQRLFSARPLAGWNWAEYDDRRIGWKDLPQFFSSFEYKDCSGGSEGFCLLAPSETNREVLASVRYSAKQEVDTAARPKTRASARR